VTDNGRGMAQSKGRSWSKQSEPGLGLRGMEERTKLLRGQLTIRSRTGRGTELTLTVPLPATETTQVMLGS
jgi:signal transduction histidine kinase